MIYKNAILEGFTGENMNEPLWMWIIFIGVVFFLLVLDLGKLNRKQHKISIKKSLYMSGFYIIIAFLFGCWIWRQFGEQSAKEYISGFFIEKSLAIDNIFIISLIFNFFAIPLQHQHRVLVLGILGAILLRAIMIGLGATLVSQFSWVLYIFAVFLIITGVKMLWALDQPIDINNNHILKFIYKHMRITATLNGKNFFIKVKDKKTGKYMIYCTPLFICLLMVEFTDLIFAVDSIPAIFMITTDTYVVYTSNIFAILGLRALYFALAIIVHRFIYLKHTLAVLLIFVTLNQRTLAMV